MKFKIVVDSSANLLPDYISDSEVGFEVAPLTIRIGDKDFIDNEKLDIKQMLDALSSFKGKATTSCPSPQSFLEAYNGAENVICITISSKLSGTFNSAFVAATEAKSKVHVVDSKGTSGMMVLLVDKAYELIKKGLSFEEVSHELDEFQKTLNLFFVLDSFDNLVRNGRMSKIVAFIASKASIKPLCVANDGEIKVYKKLRTMKMATKALVDDMKDLFKDQDITQRDCVVTCIQGEEEGERVKQMIEETYSFRSVRLVSHRGLCAFYALPGGIIVSF